MKFADCNIFVTTRMPQFPGKHAASCPIALCTPAAHYTQMVASPFISDYLNCSIHVVGGIQ